MGNALIVLEIGDLRLRFLKDRDQVFLEFQSVFDTTSDKWFSFGMVRQLITGEVNDDDIMWGTIGGDVAMDDKKAKCNSKFVAAQLQRFRTHFPRLAILQRGRRCLSLRKRDHNDSSMVPEFISHGRSS